MEKEDALRPSNTRTAVEKSFTRRAARRASSMTVARAIGRAVRQYFWGIFGVTNEVSPGDCFWRSKRQDDVVGCRSGER